MTALRADLKLVDATDRSPPARLGGGVAAHQRLPFHAVATERPRTVRLVGELDLATVETLNAAVRADLQGPGDLTLDLSDLDFMDCAGVSALIGITRQLPGAGRLILVGSSAATMRLATLTNLHLVPGIVLVAPFAPPATHAAPALRVVTG